MVDKIDGPWYSRRHGHASGRPIRGLAEAHSLSSSAKRVWEVGLTLRRRAPKKWTRSSTKAPSEGIHHLSSSRGQ